MCDADARAVLLVWPESRQPIAEGEEVQLWEDFRLDLASMTPCQATTASTVIVNAQSVDEVRERGTPRWSECGSVAVTGGWTAIGFDERSLRAIAVPAIALRERNGCAYALDEIEGHENEMTGYASWAVRGVAKLTDNPPSSARSSCVSELSLTGAVELFGPWASGYGTIPWGPSTPPCGDSYEEVEAAKALSRRMATATQLAKLGQLSRSPTDAPFSANSAGTLAVAWYADGSGRATPADSASRMLVAHAVTLFSSSGTKRVSITPTRFGRHLLRYAGYVRLELQASFTPRGRAAIVVTGTRLYHR